MPSTKRSEAKRSAKQGVVVSKKVKSYEKAPLFIKKAKAMETILKKHGLPKERLAPRTY